MLVDLGVPQEALVLQSQSQNTAEDAYFTSAILAEKQIRTVIGHLSSTHGTRPDDVRFSGNQHHPRADRL